MRRSSSAALALLSSTFLFGVGAAHADWRMTEVTGRVRVTLPGQETINGTANLTLPAGADVTTAAGARAVLVDGPKRIVVGPNSRMTVAAGQPEGMTRIVQNLGSILFQVDKQARPHFRVDTPLLAAVVKGTTFTVSISAVSDSVHVAEGLVGVSPQNGGAGSDIPAGVTGQVLRSAPDQVGVIAPSETPPPVADTVAPPLDYSEATEGLAAGPGDAPSTAMAGPPNAASPDAPEAPGTAPGAPAADVASAVAAARSNAVAFAQPAAPPPLPPQADNPNAGGGNNPDAGGGNPNAGGGNPNAGGGNPNAGGGNPNAGGGNPNAGGGNPNAGGGNPNAGGGNPNAGGGSPNAGGGNPNAGGGNPNAGGDTPNAGGGNPNAGGGNPNAGGGGNSNAGGGGRGANN